MHVLVCISNLLLPMPIIYMKYNVGKPWGIYHIYLVGLYIFCIVTSCVSMLCSHVLIHYNAAAFR